MSDLAKHIAALPPEKRQLLLQKMQEKMLSQQLQHKQAGNAQQQILPQTRKSARCALSFAQERLWFLHQLDPLSAAYNMANALHLRGQLSIATLEQSLAMVIQRHEMLRTGFQDHEGKPVQVIKPSLSLQFPVIDLRGRSQREQTNLVQQLSRQEAQRPFDLAIGPLLRARILRLDEREHILLFTMHHIITDGWSMGVLARELTTLYRANVSGQPSPLMPLPIQYADYAHWQRKWLQGTTLQEQLAYWKLQLQGVPSLLPLPTDYLRPPVQTFHGATLTKLVPLSLYEQLKTLSQQENITLFMTLLSALAILLGRYSGQHDIVVGTAVANRMHPSIEALIGFFANTLVLRCNLANDPSMRELLQRVREVTIQAYAHQDLPFEKLVEELQPERSLSHHPLFQVMFVLNNQPQIEDHLLDMQISSLVADNQTAKRDLSIAITETPKGLVMSWQYDTTLFAQEKIQRMLNHYIHLLAEMVDQPQRKLSELNQLDQQELDTVLQRWNPTDPEPPMYTTIMQWFNARVTSTPDAIALVCGQQHLSYWDLAERAKHVGHALQRLGVGPEVRVGLYLERSLELLVGLFGILNAGGAYLPLDPSYPRERLAFMLQDAQIALLLTQSHLRDHFSFSHLQVIGLESEWMNLTGEAEPSVMQGPEVRADNLAYVIYTSGSTGLPKGVMVTHGNVSHCIQALTSTLHITSEDTYLHTASFSFSSSIRQLFVPLSQGATVVLAAREQINDPLQLFALIQQQQVSVLDLVPTYWRSCLHALQSLRRATSEKLLDNHVRLLVTASEALPSSFPLQWKQIVAQGTQATVTTLINMFGQTETTGIVATHTQEPDQAFVSGLAPQESTVPIGRPLASCQLYLLDASLQPVPIGVPGEVYVGGPHLARCYLGRPDLTAERFVPNPFVVGSGQGRNVEAAACPCPLPPQVEGVRLYRTGDLARYLPDGTIEYLGRFDQQVKIRGYRIELGEIEAVLRAHPVIQDVVVLVREDVPGEKRLVAYLVGEHSTDLRLYLQDRLPSPMLPSAYVFLSALPLTPQGKVDRQALPVPTGDQCEAKKAQENPATPVEELVMSVWCEVLSRTQVGIHDNFFELGGHSLLAIQLIARVRALLGVEIPIRAVFESPTVSELTLQIEQALRLDEALQIPPLTVMERPEEISLSFAQERLWVLDQLEPESTTYLVMHMLSVEGGLDVHSLEHSLQELIQRHEILRTTFREGGSAQGTRGSAQGTIPTGQPVQMIHPASHYVLPVIDLQGLRQEQKQREAQRLTAQEAQRPFDLAKGPLLRTALLRLEMQEHALLLTLHHIITDGWSNRVMVRELSTLYHSCMAGLPSPLAPLPIQYADYALWQRRWLQDEILESQLAYWQRQLSGMPGRELAPYLQLPTDRPRKASRTNAGAKLSRLLSPALLQELEHVSHQKGVTLFMTLLAAFQVLLMRYSGQQDIVVGTPIANRGQAGLEDLIGFFVNMLVLRSDLSGNPSFRQLLARIREVTLQAYAHQDLPFEKLVASGLDPDLVSNQRSLSHAPLFQVLFVLQNIPSPDVTLAGITFRQLERAHFTTRFDLSLIVTPGEKGLLVETEYSTDLFDGTTITRLLSHWQVLLEAIVRDPEQQIETLPMLTEAEREQILTQGTGSTMQRNATSGDLANAQCDRSQNWCVHHLFERQVEQTPDSVALVFGKNAVLTYAELNRRANQLAHYLQSLGVGPEVLVGICLSRSIEMAVGLLAVLKAGGAYVPLDPTYPLDRLAFMIQDTHVQVLLTQQQLREQIPASSVHLLVLEQVWETVLSQSDQNPQSLVEASNLAYIIYTSGSTGVPKGVQVTHEGLCNLGLAQADSFATGPDSRILQFASLSFDASIWEIVMALLVGGSLHLEEITQMLPGMDLLQILQEQAITIVTLPPSALAALPTSASLPALQTLLVAGEACPVELMAHWAVGRNFFNAYGPTESTVCASMAQCTESDLNRNALSLGQPLANTQLYVLDRHLQPVPIGVTGEIYLGGVGLARGYLHHPNLTAERFIPDPFNVETGTRLYRTGDLARFLPDGKLEFVGRADQQVKMRGYRIELGEIEAILSEYPAVQECVVVKRENPSLDEQLVAYVVCQSVPQFCYEAPHYEKAFRGSPFYQRIFSDRSIPIKKENRQETRVSAAEEIQSRLSDMRTHLQDRLPAYMIPSALVPLDTLPLTHNGKVDRRALALRTINPTETRRGSGLSMPASVSPMAPTTPLQEVLVTVWEDVLNLEQVGIHDHFFKIGGHSLLATRVVARIRQALEVDLPLRSLFEAPTIAQLSQHLDRFMQRSPSLPVPALVPIERSVDLHRRAAYMPLSFTQERLWFLYQWAPSSAWYNVPIALRLSGPLHVEALERSVAIVVERHEVLRTTFVQHSGQPVQVISSDLLIQTPVIDLCGLAFTERDQLVTQLAHAEAQRPFDLANGPLIRICLLRLDVAVPQQHVLLLTLHHIITDGWSMEILVREITTPYQAAVSGEADLKTEALSLLPELLIQYADYAHWQRQWLQDEVLEAQLAYWRRQLAHLSPLELPTDHLRPAVRTDRGARRSRLLPLVLSLGLLQLCQKLDVTLFMLLLATFQVFLMRYTGQTNISVGTPIANRTRTELEELIGCFVNTLVLRTDLAGHPTFLAVLHRVREVCLRAYAHQDVPFEKVVEALTQDRGPITRDISRTPLFQVMFVLQRKGTSSILIEQEDLAGLRITPMKVESTASKFDLTLSIHETASGEFHCIMEYSTDLFEAETITRWLANFQTLLEGVIQNPQAHVSDLPLLTEAERKLVASGFALRTGASPVPTSLCVHQLFERQVEQTPDSIALAFGESEMLTYTELNQRANHLAYHLQDLDVGPEVLVGICMERSIEMVVGLLGILKAGGAYVPLDPKLPRERLTFLLSDARVSLVLTQAHLHDLIEQAHKQLSTVEFIRLEPDTRISSTRASTPGYKNSKNWDHPVCRVQPDNLAYLIYTSGSTGQPKGVQISHYAVCNFLAAMKEQPGLEAWDTLLAITPLPFDIASLELFSPLVTGARVVIASRETAMDGQKLAYILDEQSATIMQTTPSIWRILLDAHWQPARPMRVLCGGEAFPPDLARQLLDLGVTVWNLYGPTETTIWSTLCPITSELKAVGTRTGASPVPTRSLVDGPLPIGHPIANTQIYLLDKYLQPVPIGVIGELYIGGIGLARGYWRRPELTAERFIANPFVGPASVGERLYRTGDLARYQADGTIEVLGRTDQQVKLRGLRIELGEIEATLRGHPAIQEAVVMLREENETRKYLIAYVVTRDPVGTRTGLAPVRVPTAPVGAVTPTILQGYLHERLPDYMVPTHVVFLETLPLSLNGKVDRKALSVPNWSGLPESAEMTPRTPVQEQLALIWAELLHLPQVSIRDNFFELGGHSLLAVELLNRINKHFDPWYKTHGLQALSLTTLFQAPTIEQIAALLEKPMRPEESHISVAQSTGPAQGTSQRGPALSTPTPACVPIQPLGEKHPFFCVHPAPGVIFCFLDLAKHLRHDRPFYAIQAPGLYVDVDGEQPPARAGNCKGTPTASQVFSGIEDMATGYIDALLAIQPEGPYFLGGYSFGGLVAFEMARQLEARGGSIALLALLDSYPSEQKVSASRAADTELLMNMVELLSHYRSTKIAVSHEDLCHLQPDEQLAYVLDRLREGQVVPNDMDLSQLRRHLRVYEAHMSCLRGYQPKPYAGRITLLRSADAKPDPSLWAALSAEPVEVYTVTGDHLSMVVEPYVQSLAAQLQQCLDFEDGFNENNVGLRKEIER